MKNSQKIKFEDYLHYDETSSTFLRWRVSIGKAKIGKEAGKFQYRKDGSKSAIRVGLFGKLYQAHRVIYEMLNGEIPYGMVIDHLDGNPFNNKTSNLKVKSKENNARNLKLNITNTSGFAGVSLRYSNKFRNLNYQSSYVDEHGIRRCKNFSHLKYGESEALRLACEWRDLNIQRLKELGFEYTERSKE